MKKLAALGCSALLAIALATPAFGQGISVGAKAGLSLGKLSGDALPSGLENRTGFLAGGALGIDLMPMFTVEVNALYSQKGTKFSETISGIGTVESKIKLDYIEVPVLATVNIPVTGAPVSPRVYAGPAVAFEASCKLAESGAGLDVSADCGSDLPRKKVDFGAVFGAGANFPAGPGAVTVDGRYNLGLANLNDTAGSSETAKTRTWQFLAGYMVHLGL